MTEHNSTEIDASDRGRRDAAPGVFVVELPIVNAYLVGEPGAGDRNWTLVDAGLPGTGGLIARAAARRFGAAARPSAIVLTHAHVDHVGALEALVNRWGAPVYAHPHELPYLEGRSKYPPPDPGVGGGLMPVLALAFPRSGPDLRGRVWPLPADGTIPGMDGWRWLHTPGHTPGHVSLFRESDRTLIAGDAVVTTRQESVYAAVAKPVEMHGPPTYFTPDFASARESARELASLEPEFLVTGHGRPMRGPAMREALKGLARDFDERAVPRHGRYAGRPARFDATGAVAELPPPNTALLVPIMGGAIAVAVAAALANAARRRASH